MGDRGRRGGGKAKLGSATTRSASTAATTTRAPAIARRSDRRRAPGPAVGCFSGQSRYKNGDGHEVGEPAEHLDEARGSAGMPSTPVSSAAWVPNPWGARPRQADGGLLADEDPAGLVRRTQRAQAPARQPSSTRKTPVMRKNRARFRLERRRGRCRRKSRSRQRSQPHRRSAPALAAEHAGRRLEGPRSRKTAVSKPSLSTARNAMPTRWAPAGRAILQCTPPACCSSSARMTLTRVARSSSRSSPSPR